MICCVVFNTIKLIIQLNVICRAVVDACCSYYNVQNIEGRSTRHSMQRNGARQQVTTGTNPQNHGTNIKYSDPPVW